MMTYLELLQALEHRLGYQHVPLNPCATDLKSLFECSPVHHELIHNLVRAIYRSNGCQRLTDPVTREDSFAAIGPVRRDALKTPTTDIDAYHLLEDLCHALDEIFTIEPTPGAAPDHRSAEVIPLNAARRRR